MISETRLVGDTLPAIRADLLLSAVTAASGAEDSRVAGVFVNPILAVSLPDYIAGEQDSRALTFVFFVVINMTLLNDITVIGTVPLQTTKVTFGFAVDLRIVQPLVRSVTDDLDKPPI